MMTTTINHLQLLVTIVLQVLFKLLCLTSPPVNYPVPNHAPVIPPPNPATYPQPDPVMAADYPSPDPTPVQPRPYSNNYPPPNPTPIHNNCYP